MSRSLTTGAALAGVLFALTLGTAFAEPMKVGAKLDGPSETPPNDSKGTGLLTGIFDPATKKLSWNVTYSGLTGEGTMAHFHAPAPAGKAAGVEIPINGSIASPIKGEATLTDEQVKNLTDGMTYFNVHTKEHPKGEIRGQVTIEK